jgi:hypothetical protein
MDRPGPALRIIERLLSFWLDLGRSQAWSLFFFASLLAIGLCTAFVGAIPTRIYGVDIFLQLEDGWRLVNGQRPHVDFYSPWGAFTFMPVALGMILSNNSVNSVGYGSALFGLLVGLWSYRLTRDRMEGAPRLLVCFGMVGLVVAPFSIGKSPFLSSHAMFYNRYGYALLGLIMLEGFQSAKDSGRDKEDLLGGFSSGAAIALLLFLKASYFLVAVVLAGFSILFWPRRRQRIAGMAAGFCALSLLFLAYLKFDALAMLRDLRMAAGARSQSLSQGNLIFSIRNDKTTFLIVVMLAVVNYLEKEILEKSGAGFRLILAAGLTFAADQLVRASNQQARALPLIGLFALIVVNSITTRRRQMPEPAARASLTGYVAVLSLAGLLFLPQIAWDMTGLAYGVLQKAHPSHRESAGHFTDARLAPLILYDFEADPGPNGNPLTDVVNDGIALVRKSSAENEKVLVIMAYNAFSYALGREPASGGIPGMAYNYTVSDKYHPSPDRFFRNADIVMVPKYRMPHMDFDPAFGLYETALNERFRVAAESELWLLYKRK